MVLETYHVLTGLEIKGIGNSSSKGSKSISLWTWIFRLNQCCGVCRVPNLLVDCIQLLLEHHGQSLCIRVAAGWEEVHGAKQCLPVVVVDVRHFRVALKVVASQNPQLLRAPFMLPQWFGLQRRRITTVDKWMHPLGSDDLFFTKSKHHFLSCHQNSCRETRSLRSNIDAWNILFHATELTQRAARLSQDLLFLASSQLILLTLPWDTFSTGF